MFLLFLFHGQFFLEEEKVETSKRSAQKVKSTLAGLENEKFSQSVIEGQKYLFEQLDSGYLDKPENVKSYLDDAEKIKAKMENSRISDFRAELAKDGQFVFSKELAKELLSFKFHADRLAEVQATIFRPIIYGDPEVLGENALKELAQIGETKRISGGQPVIRERMLLLACFSKMFPDLPKAEIERYKSAVVGLDNRGYLSSGEERESQEKPFEIICEDGRKWRLPRALRKIYFLGATKEGSPITRYEGDGTVREKHRGRYVAVGDYAFETISSSCAGGAIGVEDGIEFSGGNDDYFSMRMFNDAQAAGLSLTDVSGVPLFVEQREERKVIVFPIPSATTEIVDGYIVPSENIVEIHLSRDQNIERIQDEEGKKGVNEYISRLIKSALEERVKGNGEK